MSRPYRCVVFAAVSTKAQAADDRDSIPHQIKRAREIIEHRGWSEVTDPLIVPGQSRSIDFLHEAIEEVPAIAALIKLARQGEIDLVLCRDYDRLARTRALLTQLSSYLSRCRVQIYALDKPVEPADPAELHRRGRGIQSAATVEAFAGLMVEGEVNRIVNRHYFGLNAAMRAGLWHHSRVAYGYTRKAPHSTSEQPIYLSIPLPVAGEIAVIRRIDRMFLEDGMGSVTIARTLNAERIPSPTGKQWRNSIILKVLKNPFYCGYIVWGLTRMTTIFDPGKGSFTSRSLPIPAIENITRRLGHPPTLFDLLDHAGELAQHDVVIVRGQHEPIRNEGMQRAIYDELDRRRVMGGRAASTIGRPPLFSGIIFCGYCGSPMVAMTRRTTERIYYICRLRRTGGTCTESRVWAREIRLYERVMAILGEIALTPSAIDLYLQTRADRNLEDLHQERDELNVALNTIDGRRQRWDDAYETGTIDLSKYSERLASLDQTRDDIQYRLGMVEERLSRTRTFENRRAAILEAVQNPPLLEDRAGTKVYLRKIIEKIIIRAGTIERIIVRC